MMSQSEFDRDQPAKLGKETLIAIILTLQQQVRQLQQVVDEQATAQRRLDTRSRRDIMWTTPSCLACPPTLRLIDSILESGARIHRDAYRIQLIGSR